MTARRPPFVLALTTVVVVGAATVVAQRGPATPPVIDTAGLVQLADHTWAIPDNDVSFVPNVGIVVGTDATLVIDPGLGRRNGEIVLAEARRLGGASTDLYIASTHFHPEHTSGYIAFPPEALYVNSTVQEAEFDENGLQMFEMFAGFSPDTGELLADAARRPAAITFDREYMLDLGGVVVELVTVGPTHTRGDMGFYVAGDDVLFAGDVVMNQSFLAASGGSSMEAWLTAFDTFEAFGPATIVPAHGAVGPGSLIDDNRQLMLEIRNRARELKAAGRSADEAADEIQADLVERHPDWPRANGIAAAARSAWQEAP